MENRISDAMNNSRICFVWGGHYSSYLLGCLAYLVNKRSEKLINGSVQNIGLSRHDAPSRYFCHHPTHPASQAFSPTVPLIIWTTINNTNYPAFSDPVFQTWAVALTRFRARGLS